MSSAEPKVNSYLEFARDVLPRVRAVRRIICFFHLFFPFFFEKKSTHPRLVSSSLFSLFQLSTSQPKQTGRVQRDPDHGDPGARLLRLVRVPRHQLLRREFFFTFFFSRFSGFFSFLSLLSDFLLPLLHRPSFLFAPLRARSRSLEKTLEHSPPSHLFRPLPAAAPRTSSRR